MLNEHTVTLLGHLIGYRSPNDGGGWSSEGVTAIRKGGPLHEAARELAENGLVVIEPCGLDRDRLFIYTATANAKRKHLTRS